ncbi:MAG: sialate O-acetylesterase [Paludibacter sp.]|nr:sialate O-acetylesterase [Paludibacter sp.]
MRKLFLSLFCLLAISAIAGATLRLPAILSNHAVLQQSAEVKLWGWAQNTTPVRISCSWNATDTVIVNPSKDWTWITTVKTPKAGGPYTITFISGNEKVVIEDILIGEVWLCSGQSNMEFNFSWGVNDAGDAVSKSTNNELRFFEIPRLYDNFPQTDCPGKWKISSPETVEKMSVVGYFFGKKINTMIKAPVGLIASYWGGTCVQSWMPAGCFTHDAELQRAAYNLKPVSWAPVEPSIIYNSMIYPVTNYRIAGSIWYQGEGNTEQPQEYGKLFAGLIKGWREKFQQEFPFYYVQIAPWSGYGGLSGTLLREQQETALTIPKTGMVVVGDLVDDLTNIHPKIKQEVANRLANMVLKEQYGFNSLQPYFPHFAQLNIQKNKAIITVTSIGKLNCKDKSIKSFEIAGNDKVFYPAVAVIEKNNTITLTSKQVKMPVAVRYCFTNDGVPNLFDVNGLPLIPFRTDKW